LTRIGLFSIAALASAAAPQPPVAKILPARTVVVGERSVISVDVAPLQDTLIVLPANERIRHIFNGDAADWLVEQPAGTASRYLSVKVKTDDSVTTTISVVSDHDKSYTFRLVRNVAQGDSKLFIDPDSQLAADIAAPSEWVPREELEKEKAASEFATREAGQTAAAAKAKADTEVEAFRASYPAQLHFDYRFDQKKADKLGVEAIWRDARFTYIRADTQEAPSFYEVKDGKPSLVQWSLKDGVYTVEKVIVEGYLAIGKERLLIHREGA
jgi:type IV secretion system protein VirB9